MEAFVLRLLHIDLHSHYLPEKVELGIKTFNLRSVRIAEVASVDVQPGPPRHQVSYHLHESLLLERVAHVLVALQIALDQLDLAELELSLTHDQVVHHL